MFDFITKQEENTSFASLKDGDVFHLVTFKDIKHHSPQVSIHILYPPTQITLFSLSECDGKHYIQSYLRTNK